MLYFFYGENSFAARQKINELIQRYRKSTDDADFGLHRFEGGADPSLVMTALTSQPMFAQNSLVIIEDATKDTRLQEVVLTGIDRIPDSTVAVIYEREVDRRSRWFKQLKARAKSVEFKNKSEAQLVTWICNEAEKKGAHITKATARFLLEWVGDDQWQLSREVDKLAVHGKISEEMISQLVAPSPRHTIFELLDSLSSGNRQRALGYLDDLRAQNIHELEVLSMLSWHTRNLVVVASGGSLSDKELSTRHGINPFVVRKARGITRKVNLSSLISSYRCVIDADEAIKTQQLIDPESVLERTILEIAEIYQ